MHQIQRTWLDHEGGTKFYQAFLVTSGTSKVSVIHYGPIKGRMRGFRPVEGGTVEVYDGGGRFTTKVSEKLKRGYTKVPALSRTQDRDSLQDLHTELVSLFGAANAQDIVLKLGHTLDSSGAPDPDSLPAGPALNPGDEGEDKGVDDFGALPDHCGTW